MRHTTDITEARRWHKQDGGYILQIGMPSSYSDDYHYIICGKPFALSLGRTTEHLDSMTPHFDETIDANDGKDACRCMGPAEKGSGRCKCCHKQKR